MNKELLQAIGNKIDKDILIIGKGSSLDNIDFTFLKEFIIINTNDSEVIIPGDIAVFHHSWVSNFLNDSNYKCSLYISDKMLPQTINSINVGFCDISEDSPHVLSERFFDNHLEVYQFALISALKVANELCRMFSVRKKVFLLGFDFSITNGFSRQIKNGSHGNDLEFIDSQFKFQEILLKTLIVDKDKLSIEIFHIGDKPYSFYSVDAFNSIMHYINTSVPIFDNNSNNDYKVKIVAEITTNHFGDRNRLEAMIYLAKEAGADYIKLQKRDVLSFYSEEKLNSRYKSPFGDTFLDYRNGIELSFSDFEFVDKLCNKIGLKWFLSVLDFKSFEFIKPLNPAMIKLPSTISEHKEFINLISNNYKGDVVISTGYTDKEYEKFIFDTFEGNSKIYLLQCTSAYPTPHKDAQIGIVRHYYNLSKINERIIPGYSSHDLGPLCSMMAVAAGAKMIEKHVKFGDVSWAHFDQVAVDLVNGDFKRFVADVRNAEIICGEEEKIIHATEHHKYWK